TLQFTILHANFSHDYSLVAERELQRLQQSAAFFVGLSGGGDSHIHTADLVYFIVFNFRENDLLFHTHAVVTAAVERLAVDTTEVTNARQSHVDQTVHEFPHTIATQGNFTANRPAFTNFEARY